ncbi:MAG TPA: GT-D fold domain-containing glycosyltransferase [Chitinophagaceae bacterium]|nr:GT-D fold domain-containing glycosyltransferase [Chitinophagaceae bacterium]
MILRSPVYKLRFKKVSVLDQVLRTACIVSPAETLEVIEDLIKKKRPGVYMRFGDGDVNLLHGKDDSYQLASLKLQEEMNDCFSLKGPAILKSLSIHSELYGREKEMFPGNHLSSDEAASELLKQVYPFFVGYRIFSHIALHYMACYYPVIANEFLRHLKDETVLFIGNEDTDPSIVNRLFGEVIHVKTPARNAYDKIDTIEKEAVGVLNGKKEFGVVVIAMGCSGRPLAKRLYQRIPGHFFFDFGSLLDGICGNKTRAWLELTEVDYDIVLKDL